MGDNLDSFENVKPCWRSNVDKMDVAPVQGGSTNGIMLEGVNPNSIFMYADIGRVEALAYVISDFVPIVIGINFGFCRIGEILKGKGVHA